MKVEHIQHHKDTIAVILYNRPIELGVHFYAKDENALQVGKQFRAKGEKTKPHRHLPVKIEREEALQEVLYIEKGKVKIIFYNNRWEEIDSRILSKGDMILLIEGGHSFEFLEETEMIEVKQGPYDSAATKRMENDC